MTMRLRTIPIAIAATLALLVLPASALAEYLVPEGNSAVTQYTEGFPTGGGEKKAEGTNKKAATPAKTIGAANTKKLETHGQEGTEVAEVAAETAPEVEAETPTTSNQNPPEKSEPKKHKNGKQGKHAKKAKPAPDDNSKQDEGGATPPPSQGGDGPSGSSGLGEVLGAATGSSSGSLGLLLPLVILAAIAWGIATVLRQRKRTEPAATAKP
jgi:hypothetical protein